MKKHRGLKILGIIIASLLVFFVVINIIPPKKAVENNPFISDKVMLVAHRGGKTSNPENTLKAFDAAVNEFEVDVLEMDLCLTKDGKLVIIHNLYLDDNSDIEEVTNTVGDEARHYVNDYTYDELLNLNLGYKFVAEDGSTPYKDIVTFTQSDRKEVLQANHLNIITINELLDHFYTSNPNLLYIVEIKNGDELGYQAADILNELLTVTYPNYVDNVVIGTFHPEIEAYLGSSCPKLMRGASTSGAAGFLISQLLKVNLFVNSDFYCLQIPTSYNIKGIKLNLLKTNYIKRAHLRNIAVQYWTINDEETMNTIIDYGADAIMTDNPKLLKKVLEERGLR